ncbi:cyclic AMP-dependent transcription factor ATF-4-like [Uloborus diversus]|uniref:cyclic AMP-dependent transcription factor ATF-4-like n=1 Tax=Uloborus diversus TaxID=327109 RepID=UPI00240A2711|nr:cyclic AMP-dependent transcription factor ATF-4-like [Uloborus diversus]
MMFLHPLRFTWWFGKHTSSKIMVDCQINLEKWLEDVTLFQNEPEEFHFDFSELLGTPKASNEVKQVNPGLPDLGWLDEKVDLSVFDNPNNLLLHPNEAETLMLEDAANILFGLVDGNANLDTSNLPSDAFKIDENEIFKDLEVPDFQTSFGSPQISESHLASPGISSLQVNSPFFSTPVPSPTNTSSVFSDASFDVSEASPAPSDDTSDWLPYEDKSFEKTTPEVFVTVCDDVSQDTSDFEPASLEEISKSVRKRKYVNNGKEIPKIRIIMKDSLQPYKIPPSRTKDRRERKKVQNKEAAARYRIKKRMEEDLLSTEVMGLETEQKKLKEKCDGLQAEIKYLKSLMREILEKRGVLK